MRVLMIDDERQAGTSLANTLSARNDVEFFEMAGDAGEALDKLGKSSYDLLLLDINMPELAGIEFIDRLKQNVRPLPSIVFVTGHQEHTLAAFDKQTLDYGLKPCAEDGEGEGLEMRFPKTSGERAMRLMEIPSQEQRMPKASPRIAIKAKGRILFIDPGAVIAVQAEGNYVLLLQREGGSYLLRESISEMAEKLEAYGFIRIHRSVLVNASFVEEIQPCQTGEYELRVKGGKQFTVTRTYKKNLRALADFWIGTGGFLTE